MDDSTAHDSLELEVTDFGPIIEANIELRPLTVFVGPSNTGKSYLATLIYALHRFFSSRSAPWRFLSTYDRLMNVTPSNVSKDTIESLDTFLEQVSTEAKKPLSERKIVLPTPITEAIRSVFNAHGGNIGDEILRCFGINDIGGLIRKGCGNGASVVLCRRLFGESEPFKHVLGLTTGTAEFTMSVPRERILSPIAIGKGTVLVDALNDEVQSVVSRVIRAGKDQEFLARELIEVIIDFALPHLAGPLYCTAFYLPSARTGVMKAHSTLVSNLVASAPMAGLRHGTRTPALSGVLADFLQQLIELVSPSHVQSNPLSVVDREIEEKILKGTVQIESSDVVSYPRFTYQPQGWKETLPLDYASSMVSELAPVIFYLRHLVQRADTLIIEEPEAHLHPAMQVEFTRQIAALVQAGANVMVTTHSEWILEELANIVRRSELTDAGRKEMPHGEYALSPDQVGAWLFKQKRRPIGSVVEEIRFDPDAGGLETDFSEIAQQVYNDWATIGNRIAGSAK